jgi:hypothetical protein
MAYADIPINMRPALTELTTNSMQAGFSAVAAAGMGQMGGAAVSALAYSQQLMALQGAKEGAVDGAGGVAGGIKATQVELVRGALLGCLKMLRQMSEALGELTVVPCSHKRSRYRPAAMDVAAEDAPCFGIKITGVAASHPQMAQRGNGASCTATAVSDRMFPVICSADFRCVVAVVHCS